MSVKFLDIRLDATRLDEVVRSLSRLDPEAIVGLSVKTVNKVASDVHGRTVDRIVDSLNITQSRVEVDLALRLASTGQKLPTASVASPMRNVTLGRFDPGQHSKPVTWSNDRIQGMGKKFGPWRGWTKRTGDPKRGIAPNYKQSGVDVTVKRGQTKDIPGGFTMTLKEGKAAGSNLGVFTRDDAGALKHRYGPAVYQLYRNYINQDEADIQDELTREFLVNLDVQLNKVTA